MYCIYLATSTPDQHLYQHLLYTYSVIGKFSLSPIVPARETVREGSISSIWLINWILIGNETLMVKESNGTLALITFFKECTKTSQFIITKIKSTILNQYCFQVNISEHSIQV